MVYDARTCRASKVGKQFTVTVVSVAGREAAVQADALDGKPADWFAGGELAYGSGLARKSYLVMNSSAAVNGAATLTLNDPISEELPFACLLTRGCDGRRSTCIGIFDNLINFGGTETPRENLTLSAIKTDRTSGGKK